MSKGQVGTLGFLVLTLSLSLCACRGPYSIASKYPDLIGKTVRLKKDMVICSTEGHNFSVSGYLLLSSKEAAALEIRPAVQVRAGETLHVIDIVCVIDKTGKSCDFVCTYEAGESRYQFYVGPVEDSPSLANDNLLWEHVSPERRESK